MTDQHGQTTDQRLSSARAIDRGDIDVINGNSGRRSRVSSPTQAGLGITSEAPVDKLLLTTEEAAHSLGICRSKIYQLFRAKRLESVHIDGSRRIPAAALAEFVERLRAAEPTNEGGQLQ